MGQRAARQRRSQRITLHSKAKPTFAGIDPYNFYVDRNSDDNVRAVVASD